MMRTLLLLPLALLLSCGSTGDSPPETSAPSPEPDTTADAASAAQSPGADWRAYPDPPGEEWPTTPLDDARWVSVSADLGCIGRAHHGDPSSHRASLHRVLAHWQTTASAVMDFGIAVNKGDRAGELGNRVAERVQSCR
ncbi:MAG: hypothetical protein KDA24_24030 [Deltaproteobacteria bacterium]|nr:hypothetical protein [Deltaproteobacteria bacterium]